MIESEIQRSSDARRSSARADVDSRSTFSKFVRATAISRTTMRSSATPEAGTAGGAAIVRRRMAFHLRVSDVLSGLRSADDLLHISHDDADRFLRRSV